MAIYIPQIYINVSCACAEFISINSALDTIENIANKVLWNNCHIFTGYFDK